MYSMAMRSILEKAAADNGFSDYQGSAGEWLIWKAHAAPARVCLKAVGDGFGIGSDHVGAMQAILAKSKPLDDTPSGFTASFVPNSQLLSHCAGEIRRLASSLPDEPLRLYLTRLEHLPSTTEVERMRKERFGQDVFREALMLFWKGACSVTGLRHPRLLRASHIIPWKDCETDAERLNVYNGLLLAAHLDAAFDAHLISFRTDGKIIFGREISSEDMGKIGLYPEMKLRRTNPEIEMRLEQHRKITLQGGEIKGDNRIPS